MSKEATNANVKKATMIYRDLTLFKAEFVQVIYYNPEEIYYVRLL